MRRIIQNIKSASKARALLQEKKFYACIDICNSQIEATPQDFYSFYYRAQCKTHLKLYDEALEDFNEALINADKNAFPRLMKEEKQAVEVRIANVYRRQRKTEDALEVIEKLIEKHPRYSGVYVEKAGILSDLGQYQAALDSIHIAIHYRPNDKNLIKFRAELINYMTTR